MKIKIKPNLIIFEKESDWNFIQDRIKKDFGNGIFMISWRLKRELGFTVRYHRELTPYANNPTLFYSQSQIHLDFFNEANQSWFMLKYINIED